MKRPTARLLAANRRRARPLAKLLLSSVEFDAELPKVAKPIRRKRRSRPLTTFSAPTEIERLLLATQREIARMKEELSNGGPNELVSEIRELRELREQYEAEVTIYYAKQQMAQQKGD